MPLDFYNDIDLTISGNELFNETVSKISTGSFSLNPIDILNALINSATSELKSLTHYIIIFICIGMISSIVSLMGDNLKTKIGNVTFYACFSLAAGVAVKCFTVCLEYSENVVNEMYDFITKISPILITLIFTSGEPVSGSAFNPVLMSAVYVVSAICKNCIIPLASFSAVLAIANNLSEQLQVTNACRLTSSVAKWILTLSFTVFAGICGIYGFSAPALDELGGKTVKFAASSLVPVVGNFLSDTLETVVYGSKLMKNAVGTSGLVVICSICMVPVIKIGLMAVIVKVSSALVEPISDRRISRLLSEISTSITILFGMVCTISILFMICISIILAST